MEYSVLVVWIINLFLLLLVILGGYFIYTLVFGTPFYPSSAKRFKLAMKELNISEYFKAKRFIDLGSGDGRIMIAARELGAEVTGIELNPFLTLYSRLKLFIHSKIRRNLNKSGVRNNEEYRIINGSYYNHSFKDYDIVYLYIYPEHMEKIKFKLFKELKPGSLVISNTFKFSDIKPTREFGRYFVYTV